MTGIEVLDLPMIPTRNDARADSVRMYLKNLLLAVWREGEGFSGKRPFGSGGWEHELYTALINGGAIEGQLDEHGFVAEIDTKAANKLIEDAIKMLV